MSLPTENGVIIGSDGDLFLVSERHNTLGSLTGSLDIPDTSLRAFAENLRSRTEKCAAKAISYAHLVAPDKHTVNRDRFPLEDFLVLGDYYREKTEAEFLFPVELLRKLPQRAYGLTDTHWSIHGRIAIAGLVAHTLDPTAEGIDERIAQLSSLVVEAGAPVAGDLGGRFTPPRTEPAFVLRPSWRNHSFHNGVTTGNHGRINVVFSRHPKASGRLVVFGDSFMAQTLSALSAFFREILFFRSRYFHDEIVQLADPDFVLSENVERYLSGVSPDDDAPPMLIMSQLLGRGARYEGQHGRAIAALLSRRTGAPYKAFLAELERKEAAAAEAPAGIPTPTRPSKSK